MSDMQPNGTIALLTDFGFKDGYVACMKGVILGIAPQAHVVDITHEVSPQDIGEGSFLLDSVCPYYPRGTIFVAVVDPGVGTNRRALAIKTNHAYFIGPDNGLLAAMVDTARDEAPDDVDIVELVESRYWRPNISPTFHGRDIFAPVAAHLAAGVSFASLGRCIDEIVPSVLPPPRHKCHGVIEGSIIHIDRFGNCVTNVTQADLAANDAAHPTELVVELAGQRVPGLYETYSVGPVGVPMALFGSSDHLEIAVRNAPASKWFGVTVGDRVRVVLHQHTDASALNGRTPASPS